MEFPPKQNCVKLWQQSVQNPGVSGSAAQSTSVRNDRNLSGQFPFANTNRVITLSSSTHLPVTTSCLKISCSSLPNPNSNSLRVKRRWRDTNFATFLIKSKLIVFDCPVVAPLLPPARARHHDKPIRRHATSNLSLSLSLLLCLSPSLSRLFGENTLMPKGGRR